MLGSLTTAEANREFYRTVAADYEQSELCVFGARQQQRFRSAVAKALAHANAEPATLDACGGSGNASVALAEHDVIPVVVDVSPEMLELWRAKAHGLGLDSETHLRPIEEFLAHDDRHWDLIMFCSALHHLEDYDSVLALAAERLRPGGIIFTMFDPTLATRVTALLRRLDWAVHLAVSEPRQFLEKLNRAARRRPPVEDPGAYVGRQAERHAYAGIDDLELARRARNLGLDVVVHDRYVDARLVAVAAAFRALRAPSHFHLVLQRPLVELG